MRVIKHNFSLCRSKEFKDHKFQMLVDDFGYEDLLFMLAKNGFKIHLTEKLTEIFETQKLLQYFCNEPNKANIILVDKLSNDVAKQFVEEEIVTIILTPDHHVSDSKALQYIRFSVYPTMADIIYMNTLANPYRIHSIGHETDQKRIDLTHLLRSYEERDEENPTK